MAEGCLFCRSPAIKEWRLPAWCRMAKMAIVILKERARPLEICGFESFREAVVDESQRMPGLIALAVFGKQAGQDHRRPQFPGERRLRACDGERFGQAVYG